MPTRADIATAARRYLGELGTIYVTGTEMARAINDGQSRFQADTQLNRADATIAIKTGAREYNIGTIVEDIYEARLGTGSDRVFLKPTSRASLKHEVGDWERSTGTPSKYYADGMYLGFYPRQTAVSAWTNATAYSAGDRVSPSASSNGFIYDCITAGTSSGTEPTWPTTIDGTIGEGTGRTPVWQQSGSYWVWLRTAKDPTPLANATSSLAWCPRRFARTIAKAAAIELSGGFLAAKESSVNRLAVLYKEYLNEAGEARAIAKSRSRERQAKLRPTGYETFWR